jgi:mutator protein MutT
VPIVSIHAATGATTGRQAMTVIVVAAVVEEHGRFLLTRRLAGTHLSGLWEFPGGKVEADESHADALAREMREELAVDVVVGEKVHDVVFAYAEKTVDLHFYRCTLSGRPRPCQGQDMMWAERDALRDLPFPEADRDLIDLLTSQAPR